MSRKALRVGMAVRISELSELHRLHQAQQMQFCAGYEEHAATLDHIKGFVVLDGRVFYSLRVAAGLWPRSALGVLGGRTIFVDHPRPQSSDDAKPRRNDYGRLRQTNPRLREALIDRLSGEPHDRNQQPGDNRSIVSHPTTQPITPIDVGRPNTVYVGNLPWDITEDALFRLFSSLATVHKVELPVRREDGKFRGFAFVTLANSTQVEYVIKRLNKQEVNSAGDVVTDYEDDSSSGDEIEVLMHASLLGIVRLICDQPSRLAELEWRDLERVIAQALNGLGYTVHLTRSAKDGGKDVVASFIASGKLRKYYIEIKHWTSGKRVGDGEVTSFVSVLLRDEPDGGILLSTGGFRRPQSEALLEIKRSNLRFGNADSVVALCRLYVTATDGVMVPKDYEALLHGVTTADITELL